MGTGDRTSNLDLQGFRRGQHPGKCQSGAKSRDARPKSLGASRRGPGLGNLSQFRGPRGHKSGRHLSHSRPQTPTLLGVGGGRRLCFPCSPTFSKITSQSVLHGKGRRVPREEQHPRGRRSARWRLTSPRSARRRVSGWGSEAPHCGRGAEAAAGAGTAHGRRGSPVRGAALAAAAVAAGAALSRPRALRPSTGDLRLGGPTPASRFAQPGGTHPPATFTCADLAFHASSQILEFGSPRISPRRQSSNVNRPLPHCTPLERQPLLSHSSCFPVLFDYPADLLCSTADTWLAFRLKGFGRTKMQVTTNY